MNQPQAGTPFLVKRANKLLEEAQKLQREGKLDKAIEVYMLSLSVQPSAEAHTLLGWAYSFKNRFEEAIKECEKAIQLDREYGNPYNDIGCYLISLGKLNEAMGWLEKAKVAPKYNSPHFPHMNLGRIYTATGKVEDAIREFETALELAPGNSNCVAELMKLRGLIH
jgi:tetratricopeptide (TPR) repeat protein